jgi:hypothetical protein
LKSIGTEADRVPDDDARTDCRERRAPDSDRPQPLRDRRRSARLRSSRQSDVHTGRDDDAQRDAEHDVRDLQPHADEMPEMQTEG